MTDKHPSASPKSLLNLSSQRKANKTQKKLLLKGSPRLNQRGDPIIEQYLHKLAVKNTSYVNPSFLSTYKREYNLRSLDIFPADFSEHLKEQTSSHNSQKLEVLPSIQKVNPTNPESKQGVLKRMLNSKSPKQHLPSKTKSHSSRVRISSQPLDSSTDVQIHGNKGVRKDESVLDSPDTQVLIADETQPGDIVVPNAQYTSGNSELEKKGFSDEIVSGSKTEIQESFIQDDAHRELWKQFQPIKLSPKLKPTMDLPQKSPAQSSYRKDYTPLLMPRERSKIPQGLPPIQQDSVAKLMKDPLDKLSISSTVQLDYVKKDTQLLEKPIDPSKQPTVKGYPFRGNSQYRGDYRNWGHDALNFTREEGASPSNLQGPIRKYNSSYNEEYVARKIDTSVNDQVRNQLKNRRRNIFNFNLSLMKESESQRQYKFSYIPQNPSMKSPVQYEPTPTWRNAFVSSSKQDYMNFYSHPSLLKSPS